jgi:hypothetical protein
MALDNKTYQAAVVATVAAHIDATGGWLGDAPTEIVDGSPAEGQSADVGLSQGA